MANRRKFLAGLGALASGSAAAMGTGAFSTANVDRTLAVNVAQDNNAYLGLDPSISKYASIQSSGQMALEFNGANGQRGSGLNDNANTKFHNVFKVKNNGSKAVNILARGLDDNPETNGGVDPIALFYTYDKLENNTPAYSSYGDPDRTEDLLWGSPNPLEGAGSWAPSGDWYMQLNPGDDAYVHMEFYLKDNYSNNSVKDTLPDEFSLSAQGREELFGEEE
jgi:hypothetical protein